jgi:DNA-binding MarR family transcriptional regulator
LAALRRRYYLSVQLSQPGEGKLDHIDRVRQLWAKEVPGLDTAPIAVIARLGRLQAYVDRALHAVFSAHGLTRQSWETLASLRRVGAPYQLTPTELYQALMRTSGALTHTLHQLEYAGLVRRVPSEHDGRSVLVALTPAGLALVDRVGPEHLSNEHRMLATLTTEEQATLAGLLRRLLIFFEEQ